MVKIDVPDGFGVRDFAEIMAQIYTSVANSPNTGISHCQSQTYQTARTGLIRAIHSAYPNLPVSDIYTMMVDCGESVQYCAERVESDMFAAMREKNESYILDVTDNKNI
jgi:hypothetical protein